MSYAHELRDLLFTYFHILAHAKARHIRFELLANKFENVKLKAYHVYVSLKSIIFRLCTSNCFNCK